MSTLTAFPFIEERSEATPGLWNRMFSQLSDNIQSIASGPFETFLIGTASRLTTEVLTVGASSATADYLAFVDTSNARSNYLLGSRVGGTADGLNLYDVSGNTMIVSFSKQSIRFFQNVVGPVFDTGGALADTYNAATFIGSGSTLSGIQAAINQASIDAVSRVYLPASMYPYSASSISFIHTVQMVREGGNWNVYDVQAYGASPLGSISAVSSFAACESGRSVGGGVLEVSAGTYNLPSTVFVGSNSIVWRGTPSSTLLCSNASGPAVWFANTATNIRYLLLDGLKVVAGISGHRQPLLSFGTSGQALSRFAIRNVVLDAEGFNRDGLRFLDSFDGLLQYVTFEDFHNGGPGIRIESPTLNTGNFHIDTCQSTTNPILLLLNEAPQGNLLSCVHINNCKLARRSDLTTNSFFAGSMASAPISGATLLHLATGQGTSFLTGGWIVVDNGSQAFVDQVATISGDTLTLTATTGLPFSLSSGNPVIAGYWHTVVGDNSKAVRWTLPQAEIANMVLGFGTQAGMIDMPLIGTGVKRVLYAAKNVQGYEVNMPILFSGTLASDAIVLHQANDINNARNRLRGPIKIGASSGALRTDGGFTGATHVDRFGGTATLLGLWHQETTVAAGQSNVTMVGPMGAARSVRMRSNGVLNAMVVQASTARTASTLTATVFINGSASKFSAILDGTNSSWTIFEQINDSSTVPFAPGDRVDVRVTTDPAWTPIANDLDVSLYADT